MPILKSTLSFIKDEDYRELLVATSLCICLGTIAYHYLEGWTYIDSLYFSVVTLTTVGYGDFAPQTDAGKLFTVFYIIIGIGIIFAFVNTVFNHYFDNRVSAGSKLDFKTGEEE